MTCERKLENKKKDIERHDNTSKYFWTNLDCRWLPPAFAGDGSGCQSKIWQRADKRRTRVAAGHFAARTGQVTSPSILKVL